VTSSVGYEKQCKDAELSENVKNMYSILPHEQKHCWSYVAFSQIRLVEGKIVGPMLPLATYGWLKAK